jgi:glyoxylase-like metal-dependent hydrolase (beta-lactamase superfamily II)
MKSDWFTPYEIASGVFVLQDPIGRVVPEYDVGTVNLYLILGSHHAALIDTGMGIGDLPAACRALTDKPILALSTHSHWDHIGGLHSFSDRRIHALEADRILEGYQVDGVGQIEAAPATSMLAEGDILDLGGRDLTVRHTPGHSPGHVSFIDSHTGFLFCADTCYAGTLWMQTNDANLQDWRRSLKWLAASGARALCGGHESPVQETALAERVLDALEQAISGGSQSMPFPFDPGSIKYTFGEFNILLRGG